MESWRSSPNDRAILWSMTRAAMPVILTQYTVIVMQFIDAWMLGTLGTTELAAIATSGLLILFLVSFGTGFMSSIITTVSQECGRNQFLEGRRFAWQGVYASFILGLPMLALYPVADDIFLLYGHEPPLQLLEAAYFKVSLYSIFPQLVSVALSYYFIGIHQTHYAMVGSILGMILNAFFSYSLIFGAFGWSQMGFVGAAWGTVAASCVQAIFLLVIFKTRPSHARSDRTALSISHCTQLFRIGMPAAVHAAIDIFSWAVVLIYLIQLFGEAHQAAAAVLIRCLQVSFLPADGFASVMMSSVGQSLGANRITHAEHQTRLAFRAVATYMISMGVVFYIAREPIMHLFTNDPIVLEIGIHAMIFVSLIQLFDAMNITYTNALYAAGDTLWPSIINGSLCLIVFAGGGFYFAYYQSHLESYGIWLVATMYIGAQGIFFYLRWKSGRWRVFLSGH